MSMRHISLLTLAVLLAVASGLPAVAAQETATPTANASDEGDGTERGLGTELTAFLQTSSTAANETVDNRMWRANFRQSAVTDRDTLVADRTTTLERRLERLEARNQSLTERHESGDLSQAAYVAQQSRLAARIDGLEAAISDTDRAARQVGVQDVRLQRLKDSASTMSGPDVAKVARVIGSDSAVDGGFSKAAGPSTASNQSEASNTSVAASGSGPGSEAQGNSTGGQAEGNGNTGPDGSGGPQSGNSGRAMLHPGTLF